MGTKFEGGLIYGSMALKHWLPNIKREPKDIDVLSKIKINGFDCAWTDVFEYVLKHNRDETYVDLDLLYTIKLSHMAHDLKNKSWNKHKYDIMYMQQQRVKTNHVDFYHELKAYWEELHGNKNHIKLNKTADDFFNNDFGYSHDYLHEQFKLGEIPVYKLFLKDYNDVYVDKDKFYNLTYEQQINSVLEEVMVISFERDLNPIQGLKHVTTRMSKGWWNDFIIFNMLNIHETLFSKIEFYRSVTDKLKDKE